MKYFYLDSTPYYPSKKILRIDPSALPIHQMTGAFSVFEARLMNMEYPTYLRFLRDVLGAEIIGKKSMYPIILFTPSKEVDEFIKMMNKRVELALNYHKCPYEIETTDVIVYKESINEL